MRISFLAILISTSILFSCTSNEIGNSMDVNPETIYMDYKIISDEKLDSITCLMQYRFAGESGTTLVLSAPSHVTFNGENVPVDSSTFLGAYYQKKFLRTTFQGTNTILFTDTKNVMHEESFNFQPFELATIPTTFSKKDSLVLTFNGAQGNDHLLVEISDTSSVSADMDTTMQLAGDKLIIPAAAFRDLDPGILKFKIQKRESLPLKNPMKEGGSFTILYYLKPVELHMQD